MPEDRKRLGEALENGDLEETKRWGQQFHAYKDRLPEDQLGEALEFDWKRFEEALENGDPEEAKRWGQQFRAYKDRLPEDQLGEALAKMTELVVQVENRKKHRSIKTVRSDIDPEMLPDLSIGKEKAWFKLCPPARAFPASWEGWLVLIGYLAIMCGLPTLANYHIIRHSFLSVGLPMLIATLILALIIMWKGE